MVMSLKIRGQRIEAKGLNTKIPIRQIYAIEMRKRGTDSWETWQTHGPTDQEHKDAKRLCKRARRNFADYQFRVMRYVPEL